MLSFQCRSECSHLSLPERVVQEYFRSLGGKSHLKYAVNVLQYMPQEPPLNLVRLYISKENKSGSSWQIWILILLSFFLWRQPSREIIGGWCGCGLCPESGGDILTCSWVKYVRELVIKTRCTLQHHCPPGFAPFHGTWAVAAVLPVWGEEEYH